jgi:predicted porin
MKKSLIALSVAAAVSTGAQAQNVTVTGILDSMYLSGKYFGQSYKEIGQNGARTTNVTIRGSEDLGGGLRANFRFEVQPQLISGDGNGYNYAIAATGALAADRATQTTGQTALQSGLTGKGYSFVGLSGGFGEVQFGTINSPSFGTYAVSSGLTGLGTGIGSGYGGSHGIIGSSGTNTFTRFENSVMYSSPTINGVTFHALTRLGNSSQYGSSTGGTLRRPGVTDFALQYVAGPLTVRGAILSTKNPGTEATTNTSVTPAQANLETTTTTLAAGYNFGTVRLGAVVQNVKNDAGATSGNGNGSNTTTGKIDQERVMAHVAVPLGAWRFLAAHGYQTTNEHNVNALEGKKTTLTGVGAEYDLSKRTFVYARYETGKANDRQASSINVNGAACGAADVACSNGAFSRMGLGVSHQF